MDTCTVTPIVDRTVDDDHVLQGAGTTDYSSVDIGSPFPTLISSSVLRKCDGGGRYVPSNGDTVEKNPYTRDRLRHQVHGPSDATRVAPAAARST